MRLITFQDKYVYDYLYKLGNKVYENKNHYVYDDNMENLISLTVNEIKTSINGIPQDREFLPIWAWVVKEKDEINEGTLRELFSRFTPKCQNPVMFDMTVPNNYMILMNFGVWYDYTFDISFNNKIHTKEEFDKLFKKEKGAILQAALPLINKSWIKDYDVFNDARLNDYSQTDNEIKKLIKDGKIELNEDGGIESFLE